MRTTRRELLGASGLLLLAGCTSDPAPPPAAPVDPDDALRGAAVERERELLRSYDAVLLALPDLASRLVAVRGEHAEHLLALTGRAPTPSPAGSSAPGVPAVPPPATAAAALSSLAAAERAAATAHAADVAAASRPLAGLLAALSASEASHPVVLT